MIRPFEERLVCLQAVSLHGQGAIVFGHVKKMPRRHFSALPHPVQCFFATDPRARSPEPASPSVTRRSRAIGRVTCERRSRQSPAHRLRGGDRWQPLLLYPVGVFFRRARIGSRLTFKARAIPRCEMRSANAATTWVAFASLSFWLCGLCTHVFPHPLHLKRGVPLAFLPKRSTSADWQWLQVKAIMPWSYTTITPSP